MGVLVFLVCSVDSLIPRFVVLEYKQTLLFCSLRNANTKHDNRVGLSIDLQTKRGPELLLCLIIKI